MYFVKSPWWLKRLYPELIWHIDTAEKTLYLTFDDGPHPVATPFVLDTLKAFGAKGTFFCIGNNVLKHPGIYRRIINEGHATGNHTNRHVNGWKTTTAAYIKDVVLAASRVESSLFRPPYGRISKAQARQLLPAYRIIMWDVLSADFDVSISPEKALSHVVRYARPGSIVVFHDSEKAFKRLEYALPKTLEFFSEKGYDFKCVPV